MTEKLNFLSAINSLCCVILIMHQLPKFIEATNYVSVYRRKTYVIETIKLVVYVIGLLSYLSVGMYKTCFTCIHKNFALKFSAVSLILTAVIAYDGINEKLHHYLVYAVVNVGCMIYIYKTVVNEWQMEVKEDEYVDANSDIYKKVGSEKGDVEIAKKRETEIV